MTTDPLAPDRYGRSFADVYDDWYAQSFETDRAVRTIGELAGDGPILELGVGTGRLALPLAREGRTVVGIDASTEMLDRCPTDTNLTLVCGDMVRVDELVTIPTGSQGFALAFCAFNTILNLPSVDSIVDCLSATSRLLAPGGAIVLEGFVPGDLAELPDHDLSPARVSSADPVFIESSFDRTTGVLHGRHLQVRSDRVTSRPWRVLVLGPQDLAALAPRAGLRVAELWADWDRSPFGVRSDAFVMVLRTLHP